MEEIIKTIEKIEAQKAYLKEYAKKHPNDSLSDVFAKGVGFAPSDGYCYRCGKQIYTKISLEKASTSIITSCPHCHCSFDD